MIRDQRRREALRKLSYSDWYIDTLHWKQADKLIRAEAEQRKIDPDSAGRPYCCAYCYGRMRCEPPVYSADLENWSRATEADVWGKGAECQRKALARWWRATVRETLA